MHFFVHIPKTAGTSFRIAAERYFSSERVVCDYGEHSPVTSECVQQHLYQPEKEDKAGFLQHCQAHQVRLIAGHKAVARYAGDVGILNVISFLREPLERAYSGYLHFKRDGRFRGTFREFCQDKRQQNTHRRMLGNLSLHALGFVGLTEAYKESLRMINRINGWKLRKRHVNRSRFLEPGPKTISTEDRQVFNDLNGNDIKLYEDARWWFELRRGLEQADNPFAHGDLALVTTQAVKGWAWWSTGDEPLEVEICVNGKPEESVTADQPRKHWANLGAPRQGRVGFTAKLVLKPEDQVTCRVKKTGQPLNRTPMTTTLK